MGGAVWARGIVRIFMSAGGMLLIFGWWGGADGLDVAVEDGEGCVGAVRYDEEVYRVYIYHSYLKPSISIKS